MGNSWVITSLRSVGLRQISCSSTQWLKDFRMHFAANISEIGKMQNDEKVLHTTIMVCAKNVLEKTDSSIKNGISRNLIQISSEILFNFTTFVMHLLEQKQKLCLNNL